MSHSAALNIIFEDNHLLVVNKPPGIATQGAIAGRDSLVTMVRGYLKERYHKPGNVYVGVVSRIDAPVSGIVVLARTSKAARRLSEQFRARRVRKRYWALVEGRPSPPQGTCVDWLRYDQTARRMDLTVEQAPAAQLAELSYRVLDAISGVSLVEVELLTGRKHQIRAQLAHRGWFIVGDARYGSRRSFSRGIALHARSLTLAHPTQGICMEFVAPVPRSWKGFGLRVPR